MSWSLTIGKVAGTVVRLHIMLVLFLAWIFVSNYASSGATIAWNSMLFVALLFLCVLLHEFGHIFTARAFGVPTPYVTLLPIGGVANKIARMIWAMMAKGEHYKEAMALAA